MAKCAACGKEISGIDVNGKEIKPVLVDGNTACPFCGAFIVYRG